MRFMDLIRREQPSGPAVDNIRGYGGMTKLKGNKLHFSAPGNEMARMLDSNFQKIGDGKWQADDWIITWNHGDSFLTYSRG